MNMVDHAMNEFCTAGWIDNDGKYPDEMQEVICNDVLELLTVFSNQEHSGSSAPYVIRLFSELAAYEPIVPITGEDWEWVEVGDGIFQNKRCGHVFKRPDRFGGHPYDIDAVIMWEWYRHEDGTVRKSYFTAYESSRPIKFPYTPKKEYQFRPTGEFPKEHLDD